MTGIIKSPLFVFLLIALFCPRANAQTINAASCSFTDVLVALNSVSADGTTVVIPACPSGVFWTTSLNYTQIYSMSIIGQSTPTGYNAQGSPVGFNDQTVFIDSINRTNGDAPMLSITTAAGKSFRLSGITFTWGNAGGITDNGTLTIYGQSQSVRIDHNHFSLINDVTGQMDGWMYGVWDHNQFDLNTSNAGQGIRVGQSNWNNGTNGNSSWADSEHLGSNQWMFFENNTYNGTAGDNNFVGDCNNGGRFVYRYNTFINAQTQTHQMEGSGTDKENRGCRAFEIYNNIWSGSNSNPAYTTFFNTSGTGVIWGNSDTTGYENFVKLVNDRQSSSVCGNCTQAAAPNGWGFCGSTNGPSPWDGNTDSSGYPCIDGTSRGKGDLLTGTFPTKCDASLPSGTPGACGSGSFGGIWPHQALIPIYEWMDTWTAVPGYSGAIFLADSPSTANRDYYPWCNPANTSTGGCTSSFNGATGTGSGSFSARPSSCAAGPGGNTNGVAYWATDANTLYVCNPTNIWSAYYTPYTYPHPLAGGTLPAPPTNLTASVQ
jgi:hypothetical protein